MEAIDYVLLSNASFASFDGICFFVIGKEKDRWTLYEGKFLY